MVANSNGRDALPPQFMGRLIPNGLSVKDQGQQPASGWDAKLDDFVNNTGLEGTVRILSMFTRGSATSAL